MSQQKVIIIGAGLSGSLLAIYLAKRGIACEVYEARGDMRSSETAAGRSINLALSARGITALKEIGLDEYMLRDAVPMHGRMIHAVDGQTKLLPYSGREGEYINSVSRAGLNVALMNEAGKHTDVKFYFNERLIDFDCQSGEAKFESGAIVGGDTLIAPMARVQPSATRCFTAACRALIFPRNGSNTVTKNCTFRLAKTARFKWRKTLCTFGRGASL